MIRVAPICLAASTPSKPKAPSPTTATVEPGFTLAASAANQPVPITSERVNKLGISSSEGVSAVAIRVPSASGTRSRGACAPPTSSRCWQDDWYPVRHVGTGILGREKRTDHELTGPDRFDRASDLLNYAAVLVSHRGRLRDQLNAAIGPKVRSADTCGREADDGVRRLRNLWDFAAPRSARRVAQTQQLLA